MTSRRKTITSIVALSFIILLFGGLMAWLSVARYRGYNLTSFDLGHVSQAIGSVGRGDPLIWTAHGVAWSRLGQHVELLYFLLAPLYALAPSGETLLILQAALYSLGAIPLYRLATRHLERAWVGPVAAALYLLYPVAQTAVLFEFHADTLAMPLLLFAVDAADREAHYQYWFFILLALGSKFYVAAPVAAMGVVLWTQGKRRLGIQTALVATVWGALAFFVIRPLFAPAETAGTAATTGGFLSFYFGRLDSLASTFMLRLTNAILVLGPVAPLAWAAPAWLLPALAVTLPTVISSGPGPSFDYRYHHYALAVPFLVAAAVYGAAAMRARADNAWRGRLFLTLLLTLTFNVLLVDTPLSPLFHAAGPGSGRGMTDTGYGRTGRDAFKDRWLERNVPDDAPVMATVPLAYRLVNRPLLYRTHLKFKATPDALGDVDVVVLDALHDFVLGSEGAGIVEGGVTYERENVALLLKRPEWQLAQARDGLLLFTRESSGLTQQVETLPSSESPLPTEEMLATFNDQIGLLAVEVTALGDRRFRARYDWVALQPLSDTDELMAVSHPQNLPMARVPHLPTVALHPTTEWTPGQIIREVLEFQLPADAPAGEYPLLVGWYDTGSIHAAKTDDASRIGELHQIATLQTR